MKKTKKELLEQLGKLDIKKISDFLEKEVKEVYINSHLKPSFQGWIHKIMLDKNGNLFITGSMNNNTMLMSEYEGDSIELKRVQAYNEVDFELSYDNINELTEEEKKELLEKYLLDRDDIELYYDYLENADKYDINDFSITELEPYFIELFADKYNEIIENNLYAEWDYYVCDNFIDSILYRIEIILDNEK